MFNTSSTIIYPPISNRIILTIYSANKPSHDSVFTHIRTVYTVNIIQVVLLAMCSVAKEYLFPFQYLYAAVGRNNNIILWLLQSFTCDKLQ